MKRAVFLISGLLAAGAAGAQPVTENVPDTIERVIVTAPRWMGDKPETVIHNFVNSYAMASTATVGEISRWKLGVCAHTYGLSRPDYDQFVTDRIENIAVESGAGIKMAPCRYNVEIVFTAQPQQFLDRVRAEGVQLLGPRPSHAEAVSQMRYPIQAWYATGTRDIYGNLTLDDEDDSDAGFISAGSSLDVFATTPTVHVEGFHWRTGLNSELAHIYVSADTGRTQGMELGAVADYIAMLALSQTQSFDACKPIPSITNLISPACSSDLKPKALTDADLAYLKAVYLVDPGANLQQQQNFISASIARSLGVK